MRDRDEDGRCSKPSRLHHRSLSRDRERDRHRDIQEHRDERVKELAERVEMRRCNVNNMQSQLSSRRVRQVVSEPSHKEEEKPSAGEPLQHVRVTKMEVCSHSVRVAKIPWLFCNEMRNRLKE
ncbi:hypothetical protein Bca4012_037570 [Brassica carinata]